MSGKGKHLEKFQLTWKSWLIPAALTGNLRGNTQERKEDNTLSFGHFEFRIFA